MVDEGLTRGSDGNGGLAVGRRLGSRRRMKCGRRICSVEGVGELGWRGICREDAMAHLEARAESVEKQRSREAEQSRGARVRERK
ncbi:unnamed protein product [Linum trigynum]|uniref:Uncharacterized protein n=1 Tax=Linum trigynum TaxID=586398 RepID=A0AAV2F5P9_9ROSI